MKTRLLLFFFACLTLAAKAQQAPPTDPVRPVHIRIFPNPASSYFRIDHVPARVTEVYLYNLIGKRVRHFSAQPKAYYDISNLSNGLYLVQFADASGNVVTTQRLHKR